MNSEIVILIFSCFVFLILTIHSYFRKSNFKISTYIFSIYTLSSIMSIVFYHQPYAQANDLNGEITLWPFIYWITIFVLFCIPIHRFDSSNIICIKSDFYTLKKIAKFGFYISIIPFLEQVIQIPGIIQSASSGDLAEAMLVLHDEGTMDSLSFISRNLLRINIALYDLSFLIILVFLINGINDKKIYFYLFLVILTRNITGLMLGSRGALIEVILKLILITFIAYPIISNHQKKILKKILAGGFIAFGGIFLAITIGRSLTYQNTKSLDFTLTYFMSRYMGEGLINFNQYLPMMKETTNGEITFWSIQQILGMEPNELTADYYYGKLTSLQGIPQNIFYTFIGNFVQDFGFVLAFIWLLIVSIFFTKIISIQRNQIRLSSLYMLFFYASIILNGVTSYLYNGQHGKFVIFHFFVYFFLRLKKM